MGLLPPVTWLGGDLSVWMWDCTAGRFRGYSRGDEVVHIVSGAVTITDQVGGVVRLEEGDVAAFVAGTWATWDVEEYVKKVAITRPRSNGPLVRLDRALRAVGQRRRGLRKPAPSY